MFARTRLKQLLRTRTVVCEYSSGEGRHFGLRVHNTVNVRKLWCMYSMSFRACMHKKLIPCCDTNMFSKHVQVHSDLERPSTFVQYFSSRAKTLTRSKKRNKNDDLEDSTPLQSDHGNGEEDQEADGEFYDTEYHRDYKISLADIGKKVSVGEVVIGELQRLFSISRAEALKMVRSPQFLLVADGAILEVLYLLKEREIEGTQLKRVPWILLQSQNNLIRKMKKLQHPVMFNTLEEGLGFCYFSEKQLSMYTKQFEMEKSDFPHHKNRVYYLADALSTPVQIVAEKVLRPNRILFMDIAKMNTILDILEEYEVQPRDILCDMWIFYHNVELTKERLQLITKAGCDRPRMWMCRCPESVFERTFERYTSEKELLGNCKSKVEFLAMKLECSPEFIEAYNAGNPGLLRVHVSKLQRQLDLLQAEGFTPEQIRQSPRVLQYSEDRIRSRISALKEIGYKPTSVAILYKQPRKFDAFFQKLLTMRRRGLEFKHDIEE